MDKTAAVMFHCFNRGWGVRQVRFAHRRIPTRGGANTNFHHGPSRVFSDKVPCAHFRIYSLISVLHVLDSSKVCATLLLFMLSFVLHLHRDACTRRSLTDTCPCIHTHIHTHRHTHTQAVPHWTWKKQRRSGSSRTRLCFSRAAVK